VAVRYAGREGTRPAYRTATYRGVTIPDDVLIQFDLPMMSTTLLEACRGL